jgi:hypothetical protein
MIVSYVRSLDQKKLEAFSAAFKEHTEMVASKKVIGAWQFLAASAAGDSAAAESLKVKPISHSNSCRTTSGNTSCLEQWIWECSDVSRNPTGRDGPVGSATHICPRASPPRSTS